MDEDEVDEDDAKEMDEAALHRRKRTRGGGRGGKNHKKRHRGTQSEQAPDNVAELQASHQRAVQKHQEDLAKAHR